MIKFVREAPLSSREKKTMSGSKRSILTAKLSVWTKNRTSEIGDLCGKKSLRNFLETPRNVRSSCSLNIKRSELPPVNENSRRKTNQRPKRKGSSDESQSEVFWLKPGISLPKMRESTKSESVSPMTSSSELFTEDVTSSSSKTPVFSDGSFDECFFDNIVRAKELPKNIMGPSECQSSFEVANSDINNHTILLDDSVPEESKALKNWEEWMRIRRKQNECFSLKMERDKCKLVMNTADDIRRVREEKDLLSYARIETPDKWRGDPNFWKDPPMLSRRGMTNEYYAHKTMSDRGIIPTPEFVSVPDAVKIEKDVFSSDQPTTNPREKLEYREEQKKKYARYLRKIAPHKIEAKNLIVVGEKIKFDQKDIQPEEKEVPLIQITPPDEVVSSKTDDSVVVIVINGTEIRMNENEAGTKEYTWSLIFKRVQTGMISEEVLHVENKGTVAVRFAWSSKNSSRETVFPKRRTTMAEPYFFFDKNPGILIPGQKMQFKFYHHSKIPGYQSETWSLDLEPKLFVNGTVRLTAIVESENAAEDFLKIDAYLDSCVTSFVVRQIADEIFERAKPELPRPIEYHSLFMEEELFEFQNPAHYYRYDVVQELKSIFRQIPFDQPEEWDLNLFTLEHLIRRHVGGKSQRQLLCKFMEITKVLLRPGPGRYKFNKKHRMLYNVLCGIFECMEANMQRIRDNFTRLDGLRGDSEPEDEISRGDSLKSGGSQISGLTSSSYTEVASLHEKSISDKTVLGISCRNTFYYRHALYVTFFNYLCEAAEHAAGIIESCRLFEHHGEVITAENTNFIFEELG